MEGNIPDYLLDLGETIKDENILCTYSENCRECFMCDHCTDCTSCIESQYCFDSSECKYCFKCTSVVNCKRLRYFTEIRDFDGMGIISFILENMEKITGEDGDILSLIYFQKGGEEVDLKDVYRNFLKVKDDEQYLNNTVGTVRGTFSFKNYLSFSQIYTRLNYKPSLLLKLLMVYNGADGHYNEELKNKLLSKTKSARSRIF